MCGFWSSVFCQLTLIVLGFRLKSNTAAKLAVDLNCVLKQSNLHDFLYCLLLWSIIFIINSNHEVKESETMIIQRNVDINSWTESPTNGLESARGFFCVCFFVLSAARSSRRMECAFTLCQCFSEMWWKAFISHIFWIVFPVGLVSTLAASVFPHLERHFFSSTVRTSLEVF